MKILFHTNTLNYRGTTVAVTDYARYNQKILGNESIITYCKSNGSEKDMGNEQDVIDDLSSEFNLIGYDSGDLEKTIDKNKVDLAYFITSGVRESLPKNCRSVVHAVFQINDVHGDRYAYISEWLSNKMSDGTIPFVPHIVNLPETDENYREFFKIRPDQTVIGRIGGYFTFDIPFVKEYIKYLVNKTDRFVFIFMGTEPFIKHPCVIFLNEIHDSSRKAKFINTCDAMLHARKQGESFGLSIAEFLSLNKPVLAWDGGYDQNHLVMLKDSGLLYKDSYDIDRIIYNLSSFKEDWTKRVEQFKPEHVMEKFKDVFI